MLTNPHVNQALHPLPCLPVQLLDPDTNREEGLQVNQNTALQFVTSTLNGIKTQLCFGYTFPGFIYN